ncbi:KEOPS complex Pcc1-like subunit [Haloferax mediterranei ATCC 33500]|uniref:KEOPS complex Pcc1-like subunit n=1 Tax=Haloferax mediterranei (strain ATCC 33500 / DSM 1411 / JCM 8866 / NBRC 14739 / NCIMB 2177 / R-4) TaxID=523841 RepID=I3R288_HALMT|nr:KEOPS complex subunit Pcc1 [Haloferax mediterranei]AFK18348.1 rpo operon protein [Haloferax mediterranei ATCC 33500]AHZ22257.1 KEOPS complex Pcc1-like subunit [Haloferax mediterranei ATCC 33500]EMA02380.1 rpo operon protein [Haloferax mediterranei ATCC 33500]MDX5988438.1 KEOPS complex subunit Pcc1 [Haloferax mediterranei ATCC 33500]QCQ74860.1 KEOPS complex Pcc1-like subunit [Haloferax mediterranei ATCC 33500]
MRPAHSASLEFDYPDERRARVVERSVAVEVGEIDDARSGASVDRDGNTVVVTVEADDLVALRAGVNSWIRLVETAETVAAAGESRSQSA